MRRLTTFMGSCVGLAAVAVVPWLSHAALVGGRGAPLLVGLAMLQLLGLTLLLRAGRGAKVAGAIGGVAVALAALSGMASPRDSLIAASAIPNFGINIALLASFGASLRGGREPLVTTLARHVRGPLSAELATYTRRVTLAWSLFFAAQIAVSLALLLCAPLALWSFFVNVLNLPLLAAMFAAEYAYRRLRFRDLPRERLSDVVRAGAEVWARLVGRGARR